MSSTGPEADASRGAVEGGREASFDELVVLFAGRQRSANTRAAYRGDLNRFADWCASVGAEPLAAETGDVDHYRHACEAQGSSPATVARRLAALSSFFAFAAEQGRLASSPIPDVQRPPASAPGADPGPAGLSAADAAAFVDAGGRVSAKAAVLVDLLLLDGVKLGEVLAADAVDVAEDGESLRIMRRRGPIELDVAAATAEALRCYLQGRRAGPLLLSDSPTADAGRLTRFGADYLIKRTADAAGLQSPVSANTLRRSYVALAHGRGDSIEAIRDHVGHQDARTTRRHLPGAR